MTIGLLVCYYSRVFTRIKGSPTTKKKYLQICKATYTNGRTSHKVLGSLGAIDSLVESGEVEKLIRSLNQVLVQYNCALPLQNLIPAIKELKRYQWGGVKVIEKLWNTFQMDNFLEDQKINTDFDFGKVLSLLVLDRFMNPRSKLKTYEHAADYWGINNEEIELQYIYRSMDVLARLKPNLERHLFDINTNLFNMKVNVVFCDATTVYFQSQKKDELKDFGFSKDSKFKDVQVVIGLLMDQVGRPIGFEIFSGNTFDGHTVVQALASLKEKFEINKLIFVGDRGLCNEENLMVIAKAGYEYIVGMPIKRESRALKEQALDLDSYESTVVQHDDACSEMLRYKIIDRNCKLRNKENKKDFIEVKERILCSWTQSRARKDAHDRGILIDKAKEVLGGKSRLRKSGKAKYLVLKEEVKYLDEAKILEDEKWDGIYTIRTNNTELSKEAIYDQYHQLWRIEDCFRVMKSHLKIRPVYHWKPRRITGHLVLCFLTFALERHLEIELRKQKIQTSPAKIREAISQMQASLVEINQKEYLMRSAVDAHGRQILKSLKIKVPQDLSLTKEFS